jgi:prolyl-tRNA editing enzyme YbaK/EbsC (Cys-tRNA(Pro) deacylase)
MAALTPAARALDALGIPYRLFRHARPPGSLEEAAAERGQAAEQVVRSILFRAGGGGFVLVLMAGPGQISWPRLRERLGASQLRLARESEVREVAGCAIGAVGPLGLPRPVRILADESVFRQAEISIGSGERGTAVLLGSADLRRALGQMETVDLAVPADERMES